MYNADLVKDLNYLIRHTMQEPEAYEEIGDSSILLTKEDTPQAEYVHLHEAKIDDYHHLDGATKDYDKLYVTNYTFGVLTTPNEENINEYKQPLEGLNQYDELNKDLAEQPPSGSTYPVNLVAGAASERDFHGPKANYEGSYYGRNRETNPLSGYAKAPMNSNSPVSLEVSSKKLKHPKHEQPRSKGGLTKDMSQNLQTSMSAGSNHYLDALKGTMDGLHYQRNTLTVPFQLQHNMLKPMTPESILLAAASLKYMNNLPLQKEKEKRGGLMVRIAFAGIAVLVTILCVLVGTIIALWLPAESLTTSSPNVLSQETNAYYTPTLPANHSTLPPTSKGSKLGELNIC